MRTVAVSRSSASLSYSRLTSGRASARDLNCLRSLRIFRFLHSPSGDLKFFSGCFLRLLDELVKHYDFFVDGEVQDMKFCYLCPPTFLLPISPAGHTRPKFLGLSFFVFTPRRTDINEASVRIDGQESALTVELVSRLFDERRPSRTRRRRRRTGFGRLAGGGLVGAPHGRDRTGAFSDSNGNVL